MLREKMMAVGIITKPRLGIGRPRILFEGPYAADFDQSRDGREFLMVKRNPEAGLASQINVALRWTDELARGVPRP